MLLYLAQSLNFDIRQMIEIYFKNFLTHNNIFKEYRSLASICDVSDLFFQRLLQDYKF